MELNFEAGDLPVEFLSFADRPVPVSTDCRVVVDRMSFRYAYLKETLDNLSAPYVFFGPDTPITMVAQYAGQLYKYLASQPADRKAC